ncbi:hypothetical protein WMY93_011181 [Mugilogobius chulae]|uniref:Uncharacterized protein n=1 Tax=Mugilogobius chulae TaxID=88201 RepID=A0AAW0P384_9GOBI
MSGVVQRRYTRQAKNRLEVPAEPESGSHFTVFGEKEREINLDGRGANMPRVKGEGDETAQRSDVRGIERELVMIEEGLKAVPASQFSPTGSQRDPSCQSFTAEWEAQEDSRLLCSTVQKALFEEEERVQNLTQQVRVLERANGHLRERVKTLKRQLRQAQRDSKDQQTLNLKQTYESTQPHPDQETTAEEKTAPKKGRARN